MTISELCFCKRLSDDVISIDSHDVCQGKSELIKIFSLENVFSINLYLLILNHMVQVLCVLYPMLLGYDVLFQDVDVVWINKERDPLEFFQIESSNIAHFDVIFQHDGSNSIRYAPYSANSGFFYARANKRTQYLFTSLLYHSDLIITWDSQQQVLVQLLAEHSSLFGLNVKILGRGTDMFPGADQTSAQHPSRSSSNIV